MSEDRDWTAARAKVDDEGACRAAAIPGHKCEGPLEAAHIIGRELDPQREGAAQRVVYAIRIVPLCAGAHRDYDAHKLDLLPVLHRGEVAQAVMDVGAVDALQRITSSRSVEAALAGYRTVEEPPLIPFLEETPS